MKASATILLCLLLMPGATPKVSAQANFTNLDFESAAFPYPMPAGSTVPASEALPGWTASPGDIFRNNLIFDRGACISVEEVSLLPGTAWAGAQGNYYIQMTSGASGPGGPASISQVGSVSAGTKSLRFRAFDYLTNFVVTLGGQTLSCLIVSSNQSFFDCAADVSQFAGTSAELRFATQAPASHFGSPVLTLDSISFSDEPVVPPTRTTIAIRAEAGAGVLLTFPAQPGSSYSVQASTNFSDWTTIGAIQATNGLASFSDELAPARAARFYRVLGSSP
jgi:hypothetical protein